MAFVTAEPSEVLRTGMSLSPADREAVALSLLDSLDGNLIDQAQVDAAWGSEIRHRVDAIRRGTTKMLTGEQVDAMVEAALTESER